MNKAQLQEKLQHFNSEDESIGVEMYIQNYNTERELKTYIPAIEEGSLVPALAKMVSSQIKNKFFLDSDEHPYEVVSANSAEANNVRQIYHIKKDQIPKAEEIFSDAINNECEELPGDIELENIWAFIFKITCNGNTAYIFRKNVPVLLMKKDATYAIFFRNRKLSLLDKDILRLSPKIDVLLINEDLIILERAIFENVFMYVQAMQSSAERNVEIIKRTNLIDGIEKITELAGNKATLRKLLNINPRSKLFAQTPVQIVRKAKKYNLELKTNEDESRLAITSKKAAIAFVELLNDDYLKSEFSDNLYKTKGKSKI